MSNKPHVCTKVFLRQRPIKADRISLYLDYYPAVRNPVTGKVTRREYLGLYIYQKPVGKTAIRYNQEILEKAEGIRCLRQTALINEQFGFLDHNRKNEDFLEYFEKYAKTKGDKWLYAFKYFKKYVSGKCTFGDLSIDLCKGFGEFLEVVGSNQGLDHVLSANTIAAYWGTFRAMLKKAYLDKYLHENVNDFLESKKTELVPKEYLLLDELKQLANTDCDIPVLKRASLFSCLTGLRISDILKLRWEEIQLAPDNGYCMRFESEKTDRFVTLPISDEAYELLGERKKGIVFKGLKRSMVNHPLKEWIKRSGIEKPITFHSFRHTYATLQLAGGTDIYTVSKMLTHKNVSTTQIYADIVNKTKRDAVSRISLK